MKVKRIESIDEDFNRPIDRQSHYADHVSIDGKSKNPKYPNDICFTEKQYPDEISYEQGADKFARTPITDPHMTGYVRADGKYTKYNVKTLEFTVYSIENGQPVNITYYPCTRAQWQRIIKSYPPVANIDPKKDVK